MKVLDYPLTWKTTCFIGPGNVGCGAETFAHTNGGGDFVLFDSLGDPWPIHQCYLNRTKLNNNDWTKSFEVEIPKPKKIWKNRSDIQGADAALYLSKPTFAVIGYLQDIQRSKRDDRIKKVGNLGAQVVVKALAKYPDQLTIVTGDPDAGLRSFTAYADLRNLQTKSKGMVRAMLRAVSLIPIKGKQVVFIAEGVSDLPW